MKKLLLLLATYCTLQANAQPYSISFSGTGLSTVKVQNLTTGVIVDVPAGDVLRLSTPTGIPEVNRVRFLGLKVYPNPMTDISTLEILPPVAGDAIIYVCDISGKILTQFKDYIENYKQEFSLSGIKNGLYVIIVQGNGYQFSEKLLSNGKSNGTAIITRESNNIQSAAKKSSTKDSKGFQATVDMAYNTGERLKYTAVSGNNITVMTDIPTSDKTVTFTFIECKDGDNNYYPVVQIGTQLWMAENLKTTKYNDGQTIPKVSDDLAWYNLSSSAYCWYNNNESNKNTYGALYNWYAIRWDQLCPAGWKVADIFDWVILSTYLGGNDLSGGKLKTTGIAFWDTPNYGATNESGFSALPGGSRDYLSSFYGIKSYGIYWDAINYLPSESRALFLTFDSPYLNELTYNKKNGFSIRCLKK